MFWRLGFAESSASFFYILIFGKIILMAKKSKIRVRIAPAPTGALHIGTARTALFNYLFAKKNKGDFVVRIEDTDKKRSKKEFEKDIMDSFAWLGLKWDQVYKQSQRISWAREGAWKERG